MNFVDKETLECWANEAARGYLDNNIPLNDSIIKIASSNALNPEQIKRVVEFANISTNLELFEKCADKRFTFCQAKYDEILENLNLGEIEKTASYFSDYASPPEKKQGSYGYEFDKVASKEEKFHMSETETLDFMEKTAQAIRELESEKIAAQLELEDIEDKIYEEVKSYVLSGDQDFKEVCAYALSSFESPSDQKMIKEALLKGGHKLATHDLAISKSEVVKLAEAVPEEYIADTLDMPGSPVMVRNGNTNLYYTLDTLVKQKERVSDYDKPLLHLNDNLRYVKRKLLNY